MNHYNYSPKSSLFHEDTLVKEKIINTPFITLPRKDEVLKIDVDLSPKRCLSYKNNLEKEDDVINTFLDVTLPSIHGISPREEVLMDIDLPSSKFGPTNEGTLVQEKVMSTSFKDLPPKDESLKNDFYPKMHLPYEDNLLQEDEIISNFLNNLPSRDVYLENKEINQVNTIHVSSFDNPKPKEPPNILEVGKYICKTDAMERQLEKKYGFKIHQTFNDCVKKKEPNVLITSLSSPSHPKKHIDKDIVEKIHGILAKISLWDLIQTCPSYHRLIQEAFLL